MSDSTYMMKKLLCPLSMKVEKFMRIRMIAYYIKINIVIWINI
jgi:hypothetical protein